MEKRIGYITGLRSFTAKKSGNECYVVKAMLKDEGNDPNKVGCFDTVDLFVEKQIFDKLKREFKLFQQVELTARIGIDKVFWNMAS